MFWQCLLAHNPCLAQEALETVNAQRASNPAYQAAKNETLEASRRFFTRDLEQLIVRQLAVGMQCTPSDVDVFRLTEEQRVALLVGRDDNEFLKDAFWEEGHNRYIRGTDKILFPNGGPACKHTALFDCRPKF